MVKLLWHKMLRDMRRSWVTYLICAGIVAVGFCGYSVLSVCMDNLERSRTYFFQETNYCDGYAVMEQAPLSLVKKLRELPGVEHVEGRLVQEVPVRGFPSDETHLKLISVTGEGMNIPLLESGRQPEAGEPELVVGSGFYKAHQLSAGDELTLSIYGVERTLRVCGQGISPENIYMIKSLQEMLPAVDRYDAAFISYDTMAELFGQKGMANQFLFSMADGHSFAEIKDAVEEILKPYGFLQAYEGDEELSVSVIDLELEQVGKVSDSIPFLFLGVAAIILYIMLHRLLEQQRVQMGTLMALGIRPKWIRLHYAYPNQFPMDLLDVMREKPNVCKYLDIALQHISDNMLTRMQRHITKQETLDLIATMRREVPGICLRTRSSPVLAEFFQWIYFLGSPLW